MKRFLISALLVFTLLISSCAEIKTPDNGSAADTSSEQSSSADSTTDSTVDASVEAGDSSEESAASTEETSEETTEETSEEQSVEESRAESQDNSSSQAPSTGNGGSTTTTPGVAVPNDRVFISNGILINGTRGMEQYFGGDSNRASFCNIVNNFKKDLGEGINLYTVVAPHASCYYAPESYSNLIERGKVNFNDMKAKLNSDVKFVDTYNALWKHVDEPIYPRTEFHWGALAAFYAAEEFAKVAGVSFPPIESYKEIVKPNFIGSAYTFSKAEVIRQNPEDFYIYMPQTEYTAYYYTRGNYDLSKPNMTKNSIVFDTKSYAGAFICGDTYAVKVVTKNNTGRKLVVLKDSYGNAFAPFTLGSFDEVYILDIRYYGKNGVKFCKDVGATDVAIAVSAFTATGPVHKYLETLRTAP